MLNRTESEPGQQSTLLWLVLGLSVGLGGAVADLSLGNFMLLATPQLLAAVIGSQLPSKHFVFLIGFLAFTIVAPAWFLFPDIALMQRAAGVVSLAMVAYLLRCNTVQARHKTNLSDDDPRQRRSDNASTVFRRRKTADNRFALTRDQAHDGALLIEQLRSTGSFAPSQLKLIETQLCALDECDAVFKGVSSLSVGDQVGRYEIDEELGRGGSGYIFRGHDRQSGETVAIKILHNTRMSDRFRREMRMVQELAHPNIVTAYEVSDFHGLPFIAMELLSGPDLNDHVRDSGPLNDLTSSRYILQTARALAHAHSRDLVHRDIKPGNIMLSIDDQAKLVDLGLAVMTIQQDGKSLDETKDAHIAGTLPYMAPEQARSLGAANVQSDIYGLGATWFYLLTGKPRLPGKSFSQLFENLITRRIFRALPDDCLPDRFLRIYQRMVTYEADARYTSCDELVVDLEKALANAGESVESDDINVLVVEDSRADMLRTIALLGKTNQSLLIHQATTLSEGIEKYRGMQIDLVLLDLTLPDSAGVPTVERFRNVAPNVPIVVLTGVSNDQIAADCMDAGATSFVSKEELSVHELERTIFVTLSRHRISLP